MVRFGLNSLQWSLMNKKTHNVLILISHMVHNFQLRIEWRPVCVQAISTRLVMWQICKCQQSRSYCMNANRLSINTYIYIFQHNLCKMQVYKLVLNSSNSSINFNSGSVDLKVFGTSMSRFIDVKFKHNSNNSCWILFLIKNKNI